MNTRYLVLGFALSVLVGVTFFHHSFWGNSQNVVSNEENSLFQAISIANTPPPPEIEIIEYVNLADDKLTYDGPSLYHWNNSHLIVAGVGRRLIDKTRDGVLVYWSKQEAGKNVELHCSLFRGKMSVLDVKIPDGWSNYDTTKLSDKMAGLL